MGEYSREGDVRYNSREKYGTENAEKSRTAVRRTEERR